MRISLLLALVLAACTPQDQEGKIVEVTGQIIRKTPSDGIPIDAFFIKLDAPVLVAGKHYREAKINTYSDPVLFYVAENESKRVIANCHLSHGSSWGRDSILCTSKDLRVEP